MRKVLMVAYVFAPTAVTGVHRTLKFVRYLPQCAWQPIVLTTANSVYPATDDSLLEHVPPEAQVIRVKAAEAPHVRRLVAGVCGRLGIRSRRILDGLDWRINRLLSPLAVPDAHLPWAISAIAPGVRAILRRRIDVIYSTSWPYSDHVTALVLRAITGRPWVADFRDPWLANPNYKRDARTRLGRTEQWIEREFIRHADAVVCTSSATADDFRRRYPMAPSNKFHVIYNGFDAADMPASQPLPPRGPLRLAYVGSFYRYNTPHTFLKALAILAREGVRPEELQATFIGDMGGGQDGIESMSLSAYVQCLGRRPIGECYRLAADCQVLWFVNDPRQDIVLPGKIFEYLATGKAILALVSPKSEAMCMLNLAGGAMQADPNDPAAVAAAIRRLLQDHRAGGLDCTRNAAYVGQFTRQAQTRRLANLMDSLALRRQGGES